MDWISSLLKHLSISRSAIFAVFVTSLVMYAGPRVKPEYFEPIPAPWSIAIQAVLLFSGFLVLLWVIHFLYDFCSKKLKELIQRSKSLFLNQNEIDILFEMGVKPREPFNLDYINFSRGEGLTEIELLEVLEGLRAKGLVSRNPHASNLYSLTTRGRKSAIKIKGSLTQ